MAHSKDQVCQGPSTSTSLSDSNKTERKQIFLCFIELFYTIDFMLHLYMQIITKEKKRKENVLVRALRIFLLNLKQKLGDCCIQ